MRFARCLCVLCAHGCGQKLSPSLRNEVAAQATSTCTAFCCCPLGFLHLFLLLVLFYPCTFLAKQARYSTARATRKIKMKFQSLIESTHHREACNAREISFGFFMEIEEQMVAVEGGLECYMPQLAAAIKRKIAVLKERSGLGKRQMGSDMESSSPSFTVFSPGEEREGCQGAFQQPFWKEQFEAGQGGFWRGLNLCASTIGCSEMDSLKATGYRVALTAGDETLRFWQVFGPPDTLKRTKTKESAAAFNKYLTHICEAAATPDGV